MSATPAPTLLDPVVTPDRLLQFEESGLNVLSALSKVANRPLDHRELREFTKREAMDLAGVSEHQWRRWRDITFGPDASGWGRMTLGQIHDLQDSAGIRPRRPEGTSPAILATAQFKGGACKTTVSLHLSQYLALRGWRVLVVDLDPQGTLTRLFGYLPDQIEAEETMAVAFTNPDADTFPPLTPRHSYFDGLDIIPASLQMAGSDIGVARAFMERGMSGMKHGFYTPVQRILEPLATNYDFVILDTAPAFSFTALNVLWAATGLIVPLQPSFPDFSATVDFLGMAGDFMTRLQANSGITKVWDPVAIVHTRVDTGPSATASDLIRRMAAEAWGSARIEEYIPESKAFANAIARERSVYEVTSADVDSRSLRRAREAFDALGGRIVSLTEASWKRQINGMGVAP